MIRLSSDYQSCLGKALGCMGDDNAEPSCVSIVFCLIDEGSIQHMYMYMIDNDGSILTVFPGQ